jgi:DNA invertase Pin-like site-specific DNA recombinase
MRVAIYARVSTDDKGQDPENQLAQLRQWAQSAGHQTVEEYVDLESGRSAKRKAFARLFDDAHRRRFDCVVFWALDRFSREGMVPTIMYLQRLAAYGVGFHSYTEAHLATDNELVRNILLALLAKPRRSVSGPRPEWPALALRANALAGRGSTLSFGARSLSASRSDQ